MARKRVHSANQLSPISHGFALQQTPTLNV
jgi:hypothetical protein